MAASRTRRRTCARASNPDRLPVSRSRCRSSNAFYGAINALLNGSQLSAGSKINGCKIEAYTKCAGAKLPNTHLQGGFLGYATSNKANLSGSNFYLGSIAYGRADRSELHRHRPSGAPRP